MNYKTEIKLGFVGIIAALLVGSGEFLVHYSSAGYESDLPFGYFGYINPARMTIGHCLIILGIPLYYVGYYHIYRVLKSAAPKLSLLLLIFGVLSFIYGGIWVSSRAFLGHLYHIIVPENPELWLEVAQSYNLLLENLVTILRVVILIVSVLFVYIILKYNTPYPKWVAFFNPILMLAIVFSLFFFVPSIGNYLSPTAMNEAHLFMFSASVLALASNKK